MVPSRLASEWVFFEWEVPHAASEWTIPLTATEWTVPLAPAEWTVPVVRKTTRDTTRWGGRSTSSALPSGSITMFYHSSYHAPANGRAQNQDLINATNQRYTHLRDEARHEGDEAHKSVSLDSHTPLSDTTWNDLIASVHQVFCAISPGLPVRPCPTSLVDALLW